MTAGTTDKPSSDSPATNDGEEKSAGALSNDALSADSNGSKNNGDNKDTAPPPTQINKIKYSPNVPLVKKDKRQNSSRFNIPIDRELQKLPAIRGNYCSYSVLGNIDYRRKKLGEAAFVWC